MRTLLYLLAALMALAAPACTPTRPPGSIDASGYHNPRRSLHVAALSGRDLLPPDWRLDNLYGPEQRPKESPGYVTRYSFDVDGDGATDLVQEDYAYELRFENVRDDGVIWLRLVPISATDGQKLPRVLIRDYIDAIAGTGYEVTVFSGQVGVSAHRRFAAEVLNEAEGTVAGGAAHSVLLNVANVDQVQVVQSARQSRVKVVLARTPVEYAARRGTFPVLLVVGYSNLPEDFDASLPVFEDFLRRIHVQGVAGVRLQPMASPAPRVEATATAAPATAPGPATAGRALPATAPPVAPGSAPGPR